MCIYIPFLCPLRSEEKKKFQGLKSSVLGVLLGAGEVPEPKEKT